MANDDAPTHRSVDWLIAERETSRRDLGGAARVAAIHAEGGMSARDLIDALLDPQSFVEIGSFVQPELHDQRNGTYGDGKIGGHGKVGGRMVTVGADDVTVKAGTDAAANTRRIARLYEQAMAFRNPFVYFGQAAGARIPDILGAERMARAHGVGPIGARARAIPMAMAIVGRSYGESSFNSALSDFVVQVRGSTLAVTSPRVIEVATGETITEQELGGADVHDNQTGQIDLTVDTPLQAVDALKTFLSYMPDHALLTPARTAAPPRGAMTELRTLVPQERRRGYDMRKVLARLADGGRIFELKPRFGRSVITALSRVDGRVVGFVASQPMQQGGALTPDACDKAVQFICLCDSFNIPLVFLADTPGFLVGRQVEHNRLLHKAVLLNQVLLHVRVPRLTFVLRKAYGLAYFSMSGGHLGSIVNCAWPTAEISFMDPEVAVNVLHGGELAALEGEARTARAAVLTTEIKRATGAYDAAAGMGVDEVIDPADTGLFIAETLDRMMAHYDPVARERILNSWPTCL